MGGPLRHQTNLLLRLLLEVCALAALFYWGMRAGGGPFASIVMGLGAPLLAAVVWGLFAAPACPCRWPDGSRSS